MSKSRSRKRLTPAEMVREIQSGTRAAFYLLYGEEEFERERAGCWLIEQLAPEAGRDFNVDVLSAAGIHPREVVEVYRSYPMMASHRLVALRECEQLDAEACRQLEAVLDQPMETSVLVLVGAKLDMRRRLFQRLATEGRAVEFRTPYQDKLPAWIRSWVRRSGGTIDPEAADMLALLVGRNLRELAAEIDKALTFVGAEAHITKETVGCLAGAGRQASVFELADAIGQGDGARALILMRQLVAHGEQPTRIVAMLSRHFQLLLRAHSAMSRGIQGRENLARELGVSSYFVSGYVDQARSHAPGLLWRGMGILLEADSRLKSLGRRQAALILEVLVQRLCPVWARRQRA